MNRKLILTLIISIVTMLIVVGGVFYFVSQSNDKKIDSTAKTKNGNSEVFIEKGAEAYAKIVKPAVESYATQEISEPSTSRNKRLSIYFSADSPVLKRDIEIRSTNSAVKTSAKVTSVTFPTGDRIYATLIVKANVTSYYGNNSNTASRTYWITLNKSPSGTFLGRDIGLMEE